MCDAISNSRHSTGLVRDRRKINKQQCGFVVDNSPKARPDDSVVDVDVDDMDVIGGGKANYRSLFRVSTSKEESPYTH